MTLTRRLGVLLLALALAVVLPAAPASAATRLTGTLPNGATWIADVPARWNGTLVLFSHGFRPGPENPPADAPDAATAQALLDRGYALAGSSYAHAAGRSTRRWPTSSARSPRSRNASGRRARWSRWGSRWAAWCRRCSPRAVASTGR
ncbi:hypothetical protein [Amycolatopsis thermoflava]|uniref:hypothetical protein n=1 Tax=Amycolatopsis thermoflava TaxID=84480 RepID=UPI00381AC7AB